MAAEMLRRPPVVYARPRFLQDRITTCDLHSFSGGKGWRGKVRIVVSGHSTCFHPLLLYTETSSPTAGLLPYGASTLPSSKASRACLKAADLSASFL